jgi:hypothetical protein
MLRGLQGLQGPAGPSSAINNGFFGVYSPSSPLSVAANSITTIPIDLESLVNPNKTFVTTANTFILISGSISVTKQAQDAVKYRTILADTVTYPNPNSYEFEFDYYYGAGTSLTDNIPINAIIEPTTETTLTLAFEAIGTSPVKVVSAVMGGFVLPVTPTAVANANTIFSSP